MSQNGPSGHASTELLSAYLDHQVDPTELVFLDSHLPGCARCAGELGELDGVRSLLGRLPPVDPPRSFVVEESAVAWPAPIVQLGRSGGGRSGWSRSGGARLVAWTRAAAAVAAAFFVMFLSLDLLGLGADVKIPFGAQSRAAAPTAISIRAAATAAPAYPQAAEAAKIAASPASARSESVAPAARAAGAPTSVADAPTGRPGAEQAGSKVNSLTATPDQPVPPPAPSGLTPLRVVSLGTGALTLALIGASLIARRRALDRGVGPLEGGHR